MIRYQGIEIYPKLMTVVHRGHTHQFHTFRGRSVRWEITMHLLLGGGLTIEEFFERLHGHDPDGGPLYGPPGIKPQFWQLFPVYRELRLSLKSTRGGAEASRYSLVPQVNPEAEVYEFRATRVRHIAPYRKAAGLKPSVQRASRL